jgi:RNA polymerase sigma factor (sigma-70 family)
MNKINKLYNLIIDYKNGNKDSVIDIIEVFTPLLNKLDRQSKYCDMKSDLIVFIIELMDKLPINNSRFYHDKYIISYISKSIKNKYIHLNKKACKRISSEEELNLNVLKNNVVENKLDMLFFKALIKSLTPKEREIITYKYALNYSDIEIAERFKISRQSVNQTKIRAISKLKLKLNVMYS